MTRTSKGSSMTVRPDSMTTVKRNALNPRNGEVIFNTDTGELEYWNGILWKGEGDTVGGALITSFVQKDANYTITTSNHIIECTANTLTLSLPTAVGISGQEFVVKNSSDGIVTVEGNGSETIDNELNQELTQFDSITIISNGTNWVII